MNGQQEGDPAIAAVLVQIVDQGERPLGTTTKGRRE
jgi:hypothetical protein